MVKEKREFRTAESLAAEQITRAAVGPFLQQRGFVVIKDELRNTGLATQQFITARSSGGKILKMRVRICWRRITIGDRKYAATQLSAGLRNGDWNNTLQHLIERDRKLGNTHNLILQRDGASFVHAALIPIDALKSIWERQRDVSDNLKKRGVLSSRAANHAMNGDSPTLWLQDERRPGAHEVADVLWNWPDVENLLEINVSASASTQDTFDDCPVHDYITLGSDGAPRCSVIRSEVRRDPKVRHAVISRATGCERPGCGENRNFHGFLDVHHILGVEKSDRVWNCVALCPNCHREAHFSPNADSINIQLLEYAGQWKPQ